MNERQAQESKPNRCSWKGHQDFQQIIEQIKKKGNIQESLQMADRLYGIKKFNIMALTAERVSELYDSICRRVYKSRQSAHVDIWVGYQLKVFVWLFVCHLQESISDPEKIEIQCWEKYSRVFHNKNVDLIEYQVKMIKCGQSQGRRWDKDEDDFVTEIIRSNQNKPKWNDIAKDLYFKSDRRYFRNPKQVRERWMNHLDTQICKSEWTIQEDHFLINSVLKIGRKWAQIAKIGGGLRTQHMIKNRYFALLRREQKYSNKEYNGDVLTKKILQKLQKLINKQLSIANQYAIPLVSELEDAQKALKQTEHAFIPTIEGQKNKLKHEREKNRQEMLSQQSEQGWQYQKYLSKKLDEVELVSFINYGKYEDLYSCSEPNDDLI